MLAAFGRLWRRAPIWRAALLLALPASLLTALYPPHRGSWRRDPVPVWVPAVRPPHPVAAASGTLEAVTANQSAHPVNRLAMLDAFLPFYRQGDGDMGLSDQTVIEEEAVHRPVFSGTVPFQHQEIALPPGNWTVVSLVLEKTSDDGPASAGILLARLEGHRVTGLTLIRGSNPAKPGTLQMLPPNPHCDTTARYARWRSAASIDGHDACWFIAQETSPDQMWDLGGAPPAAQIGLGTMHLTGEQIPETMIGVTSFQLDGARWLEVSSYFDPLRSHARPAYGRTRDIKQIEADPALAAMITRMERWTEKRIPLLRHPTATRIPASIIAEVNREAPP